MTLRKTARLLKVARTLRRQEKIVDDDLPETARRYRAFREEPPEPGYVSGGFDGRGIRNR